MDWEAVAFDSSALVAGLFLLQYGADSFIENSGLILQEMGISPALSHLLTAGAEWEEVSLISPITQYSLLFCQLTLTLYQLAIAIASICQKHTQIGLGNIIGSSISNILGGLAVAMLMYPGNMCFDTSAKFYSFASFISASVFLIINYTDRMDFTGGLFYLVFFAVYIFAVGLAIYEGYLTMPVAEEEAEEAEEALPADFAGLLPALLLPDADEIEREPEREQEAPHAKLQISLYPSRVEIRPSICTPLLGRSPATSPPSTPPRLGATLWPTTMLSPSAMLSPTPRAYPSWHIPTPTASRMGPSRARTFRSFRTLRSLANSQSGADFKTIGYHVVRIIVGFLAVALSGFVLAYASASLAERFELSGTVFGLTILSIFSTLPEKFISVIAGLEGNSSLLVASIAGSNVFLLTLCLGILLVSGGEGDADAILARTLLPFEVWCTWVCSVVLLLIVWFGGRRWMGVVLLFTYAGFNVLELTVYRR